MVFSIGSLTRLSPRPPVILLELGRSVSVNLASGICLGVSLPAFGCPSVVFLCGHAVAVTSTFCQAAQRLGFGWTEVPLEVSSGPHWGQLDTGMATPKFPL